MCGEQTFSNIEQQSLEGSPPRVRGTAGGNAVGGAGDGITPACAGNRKKETSRVLLFGDHPRVCGEQSLPLLGG